MTTTLVLLILLLVQTSTTITINIIMVVVIFPGWTLSYSALTGKLHCHLHLEGMFFLLWTAN